MRAKCDLGEVCSKNLGEVKHSGTKLKFKIIANYCEEWLNTMLSAKTLEAETLVFIDCMSNTDMYNDVKNKCIISGTNSNIENVFKKFSSIHNKKFVHITNDKSKKSFECAKCMSNQIESSIDDMELKYNLSKNHERIHYKLDVSKFLDKMKYYIKFNKTKARFLILYDPFRCDIRWEELEVFLKNYNCDVIITHFMDANRVSGWLDKGHQTLKQDTKDRFRWTYDTEIETIADSLRGKKPLERVSEIRDLFITKSQEVSKQKYLEKILFYFPIFDISKNLHIYDVALFCKDVKGIKLMKKIAISQTKSIINSDFPEKYNDWFEDEGRLFYYGGAKHYHYQNVFNVRYHAEYILREFFDAMLDQSNSKEYIYSQKELSKHIEKDCFISSSPSEIYKIFKNYYSDEIKREKIDNEYFFKYERKQQ